MFRLAFSYPTSIQIHEAHASKCHWEILTFGAQSQSLSGVSRPRVWAQQSTPAALGSLPLAFWRFRRNPHSNSALQLSCGCCAAIKQNDQNGDEREEWGTSTSFQHFSSRKNARWCNSSCLMSSDDWRSTFAERRILNKPIAWWTRNCQEMCVLPI